MEQKTESKISLIIVVALITVLVMAMAIGAYLKLTDKVLISRSDYEARIAAYKQYDKLMDIQEIIDESFLWEYDKEAEFEGMYRGMLESLGDKYSRYMNKEEWESMLQSMNSSFTGVGVVFMQTDEGFYITEVIKDGPAYGAGVQAGDYILKVDGQEYGHCNQRRGRNHG